MTTKGPINFSIRRARSADAQFLAWVMLSASRSQFPRGIWDLIVGADESGCLNYLARLAVAEPRSLYHFENFLIAESNGRSASALCGFEIRPDTWSVLAESMEAVQHSIGWTEVDAAASQQRSAVIWSCFLGDVGADWAIENVATLPEFRSRGMATALVVEILREGAARGRKLAQISTYIGNYQAQSVYKKAGFTVSDEKRCPGLESVLGAAGSVCLLRKLP